MKPLYTYTHPRSLLADWYEAEQTRRKAAGLPPLTHRKLAEKLGTNSSSTLANILNGRRALTPELAARLQPVLGLDAAGQRFLLLLVDAERAAREVGDAAARVAAAETRLAAAEGLRAQRKGRAHLEAAQRTLSAACAREREVQMEIEACRRQGEIKQLEEERIQILFHWASAVILELSRCAGFQPDPTWIAETLRRRVTPERVQETLARLAQHGAWVDGGAAQPEALRTESEVPARAVRAYYEGLYQEVGAALARHLDEADPSFQRRSRLGALTVAVPAGQIDALRDRLAAMQEELHALAEGLPGERDQVVQLWLHLFPITRRTG